MKGVLTVMKKELRRFFTDTRMVVTVILLPGFLIYVMYSLMGNAMTGVFTVDEEYRYQIGISKESDYLEMVFEGLPVDVQYLIETEGKDGVKYGTIDAYLDLPAEFDDAIEAYDVADGKIAPQVAVYFNSANTIDGTVFSDYRNP